MPIRYRHSRGHVPAHAHVRDRDYDRDRDYGHDASAHGTHGHGDHVEEHFRRENELAHGTMLGA